MARCQCIMTVMLTKMSQKYDVMLSLKHGDVIKDVELPNKR